MAPIVWFIWSSRNGRLAKAQCMLMEGMFRTNLEDQTKLEIGAIYHILLE